MAWLRAVPKQPSSIKQGLIEIKQALTSLRIKRQAVMDNEVSLEYPRESRVDIYKLQISATDRVITLLNKAIAELSNYPKA
jgi:hypothetical protein